MATADKLLGYLPRYWLDYPEMVNIQKDDGIEIDRLRGDASVITTDAFIMSAQESRIAEWEKWLGLPKSGTLDERRRRILSYFQVFVKCNEAYIKETVRLLYNGAGSRVSFDTEKSILRVQIVPVPEDYAVIEFPLFVQAIEEKKPCHISLQVDRYYSTWGDIKENFASWTNVIKEKNWREILLYIHY